MGKKLTENTKAGNFVQYFITSLSLLRFLFLVAARARKAEVKQVETVKKQKAKEDALWADDDKQLQKKQQRKACNLYL